MCINPGGLESGWLFIKHIIPCFTNKRFVFAEEYFRAASAYPVPHTPPRHASVVYFTRCRKSPHFLVNVYFHYIVGGDLPIAGHFVQIAL